jgi:hypothetical protein
MNIDIGRRRIQEEQVAAAYPYVAAGGDVHAIVAGTIDGRTAEEGGLHGAVVQQTAAA